jgi:hypothetical protein
VRVASRHARDMAGSAVDRAHAVADDLFDRDAATYGADLARYRGHVHRVIGLVGHQCDVAEDKAYPLGVAAYYHDAGIWFDDIWDYLPPSIRRAVAELGPSAEHHAGLVTALIDEHHRIRRARSADPLVEAFRRADLIDVGRGLFAAGVPRSTYGELRRRYPDTGFRRMLLRAFGRGLRADPLHPAPMLKF